MRTIQLLFSFVWLTTGYAAESIETADMPICSNEQLRTIHLLHWREGDAVADHRQFKLPSIPHPFGGKPTDRWDFSFLVGVNEKGQVDCYSLDNGYGRQQKLSPERLSILGQVTAWRYKPFSEDGRITRAVVLEQVKEYEAPERHRPLPVVPVSSVHFRLCLGGGACDLKPGFLSLLTTVVISLFPDSSPWNSSIDIYGDGRVVYVAPAPAVSPLPRRHIYRVPAAQVAQLVGSLRTKDLWSLRPEYHPVGLLTDCYGSTLTIELASQRHQISDRCQGQTGISPAVAEFAEEMKRVARVDMWQRFGLDAIEQLRREGYDFRSRAASKLLTQLLSGGALDGDVVVQRLLQLGTPIETEASVLLAIHPKYSGTLLEAALQGQHTAIVDLLIQKGLLNTQGRPDQAKIDAAFRAAVLGGNLDLVKKIWNIAGTNPHPSLVYDSTAPYGPNVRKPAPVTLLFHLDTAVRDTWKGMEVTQWLETLGCDLKASTADGTTLLHNAAAVGDLRYVEYLLSKGLDPSTPGPEGKLPYAMARSEAVALRLLEAGGKRGSLASETSDPQFRYKIRDWERVKAWLASHSQQAN